MKRIVVLSVLTSICQFSYAESPRVNFPPAGQSQADMQKLMNFLTSIDGAVYRTKSMDNKVLPLSYYSTPQYWGEYVCGKLYEDTCNVVDQWRNCAANGTLGKSGTGNNLSVSIFGQHVCSDNPWQTVAKEPYGKAVGGKFYPTGADLQIERVNVYSGSNIYDASTWQIALALGYKNKLKPWKNTDNDYLNNQTELNELVDNQNHLLYIGRNGDATETAAQKYNLNRAFSPTFEYNKIRIPETMTGDGRRAFHFRMIPRVWEAEDPFIKEEKYLNKYVTSEILFPGETEKLPDNFPIGKIAWQDWKPIAGENAWAFYLGSLQAEYLLHSKDNSAISLDRIAIKNALIMLDTFSAMQSGVGAIFYVPKGSLGNTGSDKIDAAEVSVENNASALAGFHVFAKILQKMKMDNTLTAEQKPVADAAICKLDNLIFGGTTSDKRQTAGLLSFFRYQAWKSPVFIQGGFADKNGVPWRAKTAAEDDHKAVDVTTWGIAALGPKTLDAWHRPGASYWAWQDVKSWGAFKHNGVLWGVGYTDKGNKGSNLVMSAEWTAGAINLVRMLIQYYSDPKNGIPDGQRGLESLKRDEQTMSENLLRLRTDKYPSNYTAFHHDDPKDLILRDHYNKLVPLDSKHYLAYVYASKRYFIPFGWYANPLPSTTSVAWPIMLYYQFNPFTYGGSYESNEFVRQTDPKTCAMLPPPVSTDINVKIKPDVLNMDGMSFNYCTKGQWNQCGNSDWVRSLLEKNENNLKLESPLATSIPPDAKSVTIAVHIKGQSPASWPASCRFNLTAESIKQLKEGKTFVATWVGDGNGLCRIE